MMRRTLAKQIDTYYECILSPFQGYPPIEFRLVKLGNRNSALRKIDNAFSL